MFLFSFLQIYKFYFKKQNFDSRKMLKMFNSFLKGHSVLQCTTLQQVTLLEVFLNKNSRIIFTLCKYTFFFRQNQILRKKFWVKWMFFVCMHFLMTCFTKCHQCVIWVFPCLKLFTSFASTIIKVMHLKGVS